MDPQAGSLCGFCTLASMRVWRNESIPRSPGFTACKAQGLCCLPSMSCRSRFGSELWGQPAPPRSASTTHCHVPAPAPQIQLRSRHDGWFHKRRGGNRQPGSPTETTAGANETDQAHPEPEETCGAARGDSLAAFRAGMMPDSLAVSYTLQTPGAHETPRECKSKQAEDPCAVVRGDSLAAFNATRSPRATGSLHASHHAHTRSMVDSLLTEGEEGYLSPQEDAFSVLSDPEDGPPLPSFYQVPALASPGSPPNTLKVSVDVVVTAWVAEQTIGAGSTCSQRSADWPQILLEPLRLFAQLPGASRTCVWASSSVPRVRPVAARPVYKAAVEQRSGSNEAGPWCCTPGHISSAGGAACPAGSLRQCGHQLMCVPACTQAPSGGRQACAQGCTPHPGWPAVRVMTASFQGQLLPASTGVLEPTCLSLGEP